ncbi:hypothetical protein [Streptomyces cucumeris]|uniref:hypothetical protein n=1 Tax=Streptomyces cucumeris TaxID=2962890 RepID=UPI0020C9369C|nr:hypothetical protein [Streptomyces sp. NEAU-Y11]MCP9209507.1 hypothetical protein [Streptomyces sp. NEAU-Y11]
MQMSKPLKEMSLTEIQTFVNNLETRNDELTGMITDEMREAGEFGRAQLALEDIGWRPLMGTSEGANSFTLDALHHASELCRAVATVNPLVERALKVRTAYIWGSGVSVVPKEFIQGPGRPRTVNLEPELPEGIDEVLTGTLAQLELESSAATDGNLFFLVDRRTKEVLRVPFEEVTEGVSQKGNRERLLYIRRTWNDWDLELDFGASADLTPITAPKAAARGRSWIRADREGDSQGSANFAFKDVWYPTPAGLRAAGRNRAASKIAGDPVDNTKVLVHVPLNRLVGWRWGVPDVLPAVWWTKAYKEYLENCATLSKAYARFAWKVTADRSRSVRRTASAMSQAPRSDPATGAPLNVGASAVLGAGQDLAAVGGNTKVDFDSGRPLAAMIAAALDVPLPALLEDPSIAANSAATSLDTSTILVMQARQKIMNETFRTIFRALGLKVRLRWPEISEEPIHRRLQALDMAIRLGLFSAEEARAMVVDAWRDKWEDFDRKVPKLENLPHIVGGTAQGTPKPNPSINPGKPGNNSGETHPGGTGGPGAPGPLKAGNSRSTAAPKQPDPMSRGDHELRDEGTE